MLVTAIQGLWNHTSFRLALGGLLAVITLLCVSGLPNLEFNDQYRKIFRSEKEDFLEYEKLTQEFGSDENHWFILVESTSGVLITPERLEILRDLDFDLRDLDFVDSVFSIFNVRETEAREGLFPVLIPWDVADEQSGSEVTKRLAEHPLAGGTIVSKDGTKAIWIVSQGDRDLLVSELDSSYEILLDLANRYNELGSVDVSITGLPAMRCEVIRQLDNETRIFYPLVALAGIVVTWALFRSLPAVLIVVVGPLVGISWTLGGMAWTGTPMNVINNVLSPLVMVIGFADGVHLLFHFRRIRESGQNRVQASWLALAEVGPACLMTSFTTAAAMLSLAFTETEMIRGFGILAAIATMLMFVVMVVIVPLLASTRLGDMIVRRGGKTNSRTLGAGIWELIGGFVVRHAKAISFASLFFLGICLFLASRLETNYYYGEYLSGDGKTEKAAETIDRDLAGTANLVVILEWSKLPDEGEVAVQVLPALKSVGEAVSKEPILGSPVSVFSILKSHSADGSIEERFSAIRSDESVSVNGLAKLISEDQRRYLVRVSLPELGSYETNQILERLRTSLTDVEGKFDGLKITVSGLSAMTAGISRVMIRDLTESLFIAGAFIFVLLGVFLRSAPLGLSTILPNLIPLAATVAYLELTGRPLQYSSVLIFTVCLGIAVDDTVHLLSSYRRKRSEGLTVENAVSSALAEVGPALLTTSIILISGLLVLLGSGVPTTRLFGELSCFAILCALLGDILVLPALIVVFRRRVEPEA